MNATLMLRIASAISFLFALGHTLGGRKDWSPLGESDVIKAMRAFRFEVSGVSRTYMDFYRGFGFTLSVYLLLQAVVLWQLARLDPRTARPMIGAFAVASLASGILSWRFIFPVPTAFAALLTACLAFAFFLAR